MKLAPLLGSMMVWGLVAATRSRGAIAFDVNFSGDGAAGFGLITATRNADGSFTAIGGQFHWCTGNYAGATGTLVESPSSSGASSSPFHGGPALFGLDGQLSPSSDHSLLIANRTTDFIGADDLLFPGRGHFVDVFGLLFDDFTYSGPGHGPDACGGLAFNLYYYKGSYHVLVIDHYDPPSGFDLDGGGSCLNIDGGDPPPAVPEPSTLIACALMVLPLGASAVRVLRRKGWHRAAVQSLRFTVHRRRPSSALRRPIAAANLPSSIPHFSVLPCRRSSPLHVLCSARRDDCEP